MRTAAESNFLDLERLESCPSVFAKRLTSDFPNSIWVSLFLTISWLISNCSLLSNSSSSKLEELSSYFVSSFIIILYFPFSYPITLFLFGSTIVDKSSSFTIKVESSAGPAPSTSDEKQSISY